MDDGCHILSGPPLPCELVLAQVVSFDHSCWYTFITKKTENDKAGDSGPEVQVNVDRLPLHALPRNSRPESGGQSARKCRRSIINTKLIMSSTARQHRVRRVSTMHKVALGSIKVHKSLSAISSLHCGIPLSWGLWSS